MSLHLNTTGAGNVASTIPVKNNLIDFLADYKSAIYNSEKVTEALDILKTYTNEYLNDQVAGRRLVHMFGFDLKNKNWQIEPYEDHEKPGEGEHFYCFNRGHKKEVLEILKFFIEDNFKDKIEKIENDDQFVHITWKS